MEPSGRRSAIHWRTTLQSPDSSARAGSCIVYDRCKRLRAPTTEERLKSADVVIIGGGIVGSSIAYHLTEAGCRNVVVIERESSQGKGSTGKSMGGVRAQFSMPISIRMSLYS